MKDFAGRIAVITGGGMGMGRELARQLAAEGCSIALGDVSDSAMAETRRLCEASNDASETCLINSLLIEDPRGRRVTRILTHRPRPHA